MQTNDLINELGTNFIEYAVACNSDRAIPDATSGLKPVAKRILWGAYSMGASSGKPHVKCATVVGEVMGKYHPHGDSSIYLAMARLAQDWVMRYPLINWHGNKGNIIGANPSASRYTEARLSKLSEEGMLSNINKRNVEFGKNFSETLDEPKTLPTIFPNLLCNPNTGIGVAMACSWAPHNLGEVAQAIYDYIDGKEPMLPGPDFPTGGVIINKNDIPQIMHTGHGSVKVRGKYRIEKNKIIFYEIPYGLTIQGLLEEIGAVCDAKEVLGVKNVSDDTNKTGLRLVIECEKDANPNIVVNRLFNKTSLQSFFSYNQVALVRNNPEDKNLTPTELNLKDCIKIYLEHNIDCLKKETYFDLDKAQARLHIVEGLLIALTNIDDVIHIIREDDAPEDTLMERYALTKVQVTAILDMKLNRLRKLEKTKLDNEKDDLINSIKDYTNLLNSTKLQLTTIKNRLMNLVKKYGDKRRTELAQMDSPKGEDKQIEEVEPEKCVVVLTEGNTIKRIPTASFKTQKRAGKGIKTQEDITSMILRTNTIDSLMIFTNYGQMYRLLVDNIPIGTNVSKGMAITDLVEMRDGETAEVIYSIYRNTDAKYVLFTTKKGLVKKTSLEEYIKTKKKTGIAAISIKEGDALANVCLIQNEPIIIVTKKGQVIQFKSDEIAASSRVTMGIKGIALVDDDEVVMTLPVRNEDDDLALFSSIGLGKRVALKELVTQKRAGKGLSCYKISDNSGYIVTAALVTNGDNILIIGDKNSICVSADDIPVLGRSSIGNILIKNTIKAVSKI